MRAKIRRPSGEWEMDICAISWVGVRVMSMPSNRIWPFVACGLPQMVIISVVLPAPLAPIMVTISPCATSTLTARSAWILP